MANKSSGLSFRLQKNNSKKKKNMNTSSLKTKTGTKTRTRTRIITGVVLGVIAAIGIGTAIWYFAMVNIQENSIYIMETFDKRKSDDLILDGDTKFHFFQGANAPVEGLVEGQPAPETEIILRTNKDSFSRDLSKANYFCPETLKKHINKIEIFANDDMNDDMIDNNNIVKSEWLKHDLSKLKLGVKINDQVIKTEEDNFGDINLAEYLDNFNSPAWSDLLRWKSNNPNVLLILNNGLIMPTFQGTAKIQAGICGKLSNELTLNIDKNISEVDTFNNISTAGIGTERLFFTNKRIFNNQILLSKELTKTHNDINLHNKRIKKIFGRLKLCSAYDDLNKKINSANIKLLFSFDHGNTWIQAPLKQDGPWLSNYKFSQDVPQENSNALRWALIYQFNESTGSVGSLYDQKLLDSDDLVGSDREKKEKVLFLNKRLRGKNLIDLPRKMIPGPRPWAIEDFYSNHLLDIGAVIDEGFGRTKVSVINSGISNIQRKHFSGTGLDNINSAIAVTLPEDLRIDWLGFEVDLGEASGPRVLDDVFVQEESLLDVDFTAEPISGQTPLEVKFEAEASGGQGPYKYDWDFNQLARRDNKPKYWLLDSDNSSPSFTYEDPGFYWPSLTVRDSNGASDTIMGQWVNVGGFKIVADPSFGKSPLNVQFDVDASAYEEGMDLSMTDFEWEFGDGSEKSDKKNPLHIYQNPGEYDVNLNVSCPMFEGVVSTKIFVTEGEEFGVENEPDLLVDPEIIYRGADRVIIKWKVGKDELKNQDLKFKYGTDIAFDQEGNPVGGINKKAEAHYNSDEDYYYVVLRGLEGGEFSDKNDDGYIKGRKPYYFQISLGDKYGRVENFATLNRFQAILYYYNLVFGNNFTLSKYEEADNSIRGGGPAFYYEPPKDQEPLSLKGVQFALLNDRKYEEFDKRLKVTAQQYGTEQAMIEIYRRVHDRIYDDALDKYYDKAGLDYWINLVDSNEIDLLGTKFAVSTSPEYKEQFMAGLTAEQRSEAEAIIAYQEVFKRTGEQKGIDHLEKLESPDEMRRELILSDEYDARLKQILKMRGRTTAIAELYETILGREADVDGLRYWDESGSSIQEIKNELLEGEENL